MYKQIISSKLLDYLKLKKVKFKKTGQQWFFKCPVCQYDEKKTSANVLIYNAQKFRCLHCNDSYDIVDAVKAYEPEFKDANEEKILQHLKDVLKINVMTKKDEQDMESFLTNYQRWGFDLVPITTNGKIPIEKDWTKKSHKDIEEWYNWIKNGLNIGVKTGQISGITIIDIDQKPIPPEIDAIKGNCIIQESTNGYHLIYKYVADLRKTRIDELKIDIENDGGQVVIYPSVIKDVQRKFVNLKAGQTLSSIPEELKKLLLEKLTVPRQTTSEKLSKDIEVEEFNLGILKEGQRNSSLVRLGGILRKELNLNQTSYVLRALNKHLCKNPLPNQEINAMMRSIDRYSTFDEKELAHKILEHLKETDEMSRTEMAMTIVGTNRGEEKKRVDKALTYLVKEGYILKKGRSYSIRKKVEWKEVLINIGIPIDFKMPYFYDVMDFNYGDLILIGSRNARGKTHISMNIVKQLVQQNITPYYLSLEGGSRWAKIALQLGLKEGDFKWEETSNPNNVELEQNAVTIIDWLCPKNYAETDKILQSLNDKVRETKGVLIVFVQLRDNNEWLAKDLIKQFPSFACKYIYDNEDDGEYGYFKIDKVREPKIRIKSYEIPCRYDWETKELKRVEAEEDGKTKEEKAK